MPATSSAKCSAQEAVTPTAAGELSTCWSSRTKKINAKRIAEPHVNCILVVPNWLNEYIFMMILAIMSTAYDSVWLYDSFHYRLIRYLTPGFLGRKLSCVIHAIFAYFGHVRYVRCLFRTMFNCNSSTANPLILQQKTEQNQLKSRLMHIFWRIVGFQASSVLSEYPDRVSGKIALRRISELWNCIPISRSLKENRWQTSSQTALHSTGMGMCIRIPSSQHIQHTHTHTHTH